MNEAGFTAAWQMIDKRGITVSFTVAAPNNTDAMRVMSERDTFIEAALKYGWQIPNGAAPISTAAPTKGVEPPDNKLPNCHCGHPADVKTGIGKNGKPYTLFRCHKGFNSKDKCKFEQWG